MPDSQRETCRRCSAKIWLLLSGELADAERQEVERHLQVCATCRHSWQAALETQGQYAALPAYDAPEHSVQDLLAKARSKRAGRRRFAWHRPLLSASGPWIPAGSRRLVVAAGLAAAVLVVFYAMASRPDPTLAWEAPAFEAGANAAWSALTNYELETYAAEWQSSPTDTPRVELDGWDLKVLRLRLDLVDLEVQLSDAKAVSRMQ